MGYYTRRTSKKGDSSSDFYPPLRRVVIFKIENKKCLKNTKRKRNEKEAIWKIKIRHQVASLGFFCTPPFRSFHSFRQEWKKKSILFWYPTVHDKVDVVFKHSVIQIWLFTLFFWIFVVLLFLETENDTGRCSLRGNFFHCDLVETNKKGLWDFRAAGW